VRKEPLVLFGGFAPAMVGTSHVFLRQWLRWGLGYWFGLGFSVVARQSRRTSHYWASLFIRG
jgi:hypothetical protein